MLFESVAYAMGSASQGGDASGTDIIVQFVPLILMFAIFWFLLIRPQQKRAKEHKNMLSQLKKGDYVVTSGGMMGRIIEIDADSLLLKCGESKLRISRSSISNAYEPGTQEMKTERAEGKRTKDSKSDNKKKSDDSKDNAQDDAEDKKSDEPKGDDQTDAEDKKS